MNLNPGTIMPKIHMVEKNEDAGSVFDTRKKATLARIETLHRLVSSFEPPTEDITPNTIRDMNYILELLAGAIKDVKDTTGLEE